MNMSMWMKWALVLAAALLAWSVSRNFDGPILHWVITIAVVWIVWKMVM
jgi:hypothetical protein